VGHRVDQLVGAKPIPCITPGCCVGLSWSYVACCRDADAGDHPSVLTVRSERKPRGERLGALLRRWPFTFDRRRASVNDHRRLGRELELFDSDPLIGAGGRPGCLPGRRSSRRSRSTSGR
jgi:hypothetical protein